MRNHRICRYIGQAVCVVAAFIAFMSSPAQACRVLVVMSYEEDFPWDVEVKEGVDSVFNNECEVTYFYMDTKTNLAGGEQKAQEAYKLYQELQPDGVIVSDDNAQSMFVVPYLKEKVDTPVMFCGVNAEPEQYGYPAANVSGILERVNIHESLVFLQQLVPSVKTFGYMAKDSSTGQANLQQFQAQSADLPAQFTGHKLPTTQEEALAGALELREECDALFLETLQGVPDENGDPVSDKELLPLITEQFGKPTLSPFADNVKYGVLCAVVRTGQEQGRTAADMLRKAMEGTPVSDIPVTQNQYGRRIVNIETMKALGIKPNPKLLRSAEMVKTER